MATALPSGGSPVPSADTAVLTPLDRGYLGLWMGTSNSFSLSFEPIPAQEQTDLDPDSLPATASTGFQQALYAGLVRAQGFVSTLQSETMRPVRVTAAVAGLGLNIPSVTVSVTLADGTCAFTLQGIGFGLDAQLG